MDDTLRVAAIPMLAAGLAGLNPCFNGWYSQRQVTSAKTQTLKS